MKDPGIPGDIMLSAMGMGRCGLTVDFEEKLISSNHSKREAVFVLEEAEFQVNRRHLHETSPSERKTLTVIFLFAHFRFGRTQNNHLFVIAQTRKCIFSIDKL